jgi:hypothetical protein
VLQERKQQHNAAGVGNETLVAASASEWNDVRVRKSTRSDRHHNAYKSIRTVRVHYRWHPHYGRELPVLRQIRQPDRFCVRLADETSLTLPAWMCDAERCAELPAADSPCVALAAWRRLRCLLGEQAPQSLRHANASSPAAPAERSGAAYARPRNAGAASRSVASDTGAGAPPARATAPGRPPKSQPRPTPRR